MTEEIVSTVFLTLAVMSLAASLTFFFEVGGAKNASALPVGVGFVLLAGCFFWLWVG